MWQHLHNEIYDIHFIEMLMTSYTFYICFLQGTICNVQEGTLQFPENIGNLALDLRKGPCKAPKHQYSWIWGIMQGPKMYVLVLVFRKKPCKAPTCSYVWSYGILWGPKMLVFLHLPFRKGPRKAPNFGIFGHMGLWEAPEIVVFFDLCDTVFTIKYVICIW